MVAVVIVISQAKADVIGESGYLRILEGTCTDQRQVRGHSSSNHMQ